MKKKLAFLLAVAFVGLASFSTPAPVKADFCETMFGCQTRIYPEWAECVCGAAMRKFNCTICCLDGFGCCWGSEFCVE
jgi:hypothetical protein